MGMGLSRRRGQFLVCGKAGVGKSSLINSLAGREVCQVNDPGLTGGTLRAGTKLNKVTVTIENERFDIYESPGLQDGTASESEGYLSDMYQKCKDVDLFLYCVDMTSALTGDNIEAIGLITRTFGGHFWSRCLLVMTKANMVSLPASVKRKGEERDYHRRIYNNLLNTFRRHLAALGVPNTRYIPACAAGLYYRREGVFDEGMNEYRYIWHVSDTAMQSLRPVDFLPELLGRVNAFRLPSSRLYQDITLVVQVIRFLIPAIAIILTLIFLVTNKTWIISVSAILGLVWYGYYYRGIGQD